MSIDLLLAVVKLVLYAVVATLILAAAVFALGSVLIYLGRAVRK